MALELILVVVGAIVVTAVAHRRGLEPALIIVLVGIAVSLVPGFQAPHLDSQILLSVVLPPLLYSAALDFSFPTFVRNIKPILGLGVGLVVVTTFTVAALSSFLVVIPLTFATALILGAIVAPPDAVTAVAVGRKLGLPKRVMSILTGESLINDAAALALFSVAVAQVAGTHTFIEDPVLLFAYSGVLGPLVGAALGYVTLWIRRLDLSSDGDDAYTYAETEKAELVVHDAADEVLARFRRDPPAGLDPSVLAEIRKTIARVSQDADEMPDPEAQTLRAEVFAALYREVLSAQRAALIGERDAGGIDEEAVRAMLDRLDLQQAGVSARLESRF